MTRKTSRRLLVIGLIAVATSTFGVGVALAAGNGSDLARVRAATARFHDIDRALAEEYGPLHTCTDHEGGAGAMGQHYVKGAVVGDTVFDLAQPEVLVYEPMGNGRMRLVAVEFVVFAEQWAQVSSSPPTLFGRQLALVEAPNRYAVPAFYQIHVWLWKSNPAGMFNDWNTRVSCGDMGDPQ
jgi:hypothetical protein